MKLTRITYNETGEVINLHFCKDKEKEQCNEERIGDEDKEEYGFGDSTEIKISITAKEKKDK